MDFLQIWRSGPGSYVFVLNLVLLPKRTLPDMFEINKCGLYCGLVCATYSSLIGAVYLIGRFVK